MIRAILVSLGFGVGALWGLQSILGALCLIGWNDFFRPTSWARYHGWLDPATFRSHELCYAIFILSLLFTKWKRRWNVVTTVLLVLLGLVWVSAIRAQFKVPAYAKAIEATKYFVPAVIASIALVSRRWQQIYVYLLTGTVGIWMAHHGLLTLLRQAPEVHMAIPAGQMTDRNDFLVAGTACLPLMIYAAWWYEGVWQKWMRVIGKAAVFFSVIAFFTSLSRGAILGLGALLGFWAVGTGRFARRSVIALVLLMIVLPLTPDFVWERLSTIEIGADQTERSAANRIAHMIAAVDVTLDYPLTGVGPANFPYVATRYHEFAAEPHSIWLKCSAEFGIPALILFVGVIASVVLALRRIAARARRMGDKHTEALAVALCCSVVGFVASGTFTSQFLSEYLWCIVAVAGAFIASERVRMQEPDVQPGKAAAEAPLPAGVGG